MDNNYYTNNPLCISTINVSTKKNIKSYFFLGTVPSNVLMAAKRVKIIDKKLEWTKTDSTILKGFYGHKWNEKLTPKNLKQSSNIYNQNLSYEFMSIFTGGDEESDSEISESSSSDISVIYTDVSIYPEDTVYELKLKISIITKIPFYRQHLFYFINDEGPVIPYVFSLDNSPLIIDYTNIKKIILATDNIMAGITIDSKLEERKNGIFIESLETLTKLKLSEGLYINEVYLIDLFDVIKPLTEYERPNDNLVNILNDRYQFDLFYYGGILKYWPHLSLEACKIALSNPEDVSELFPDLDLDIDKLKNMFNLDSFYSNKANNWNPNKSKSQKEVITITESTIKINPMSVNLKVNVRNIFDWISLDKNIVSCIAKFDIKNLENNLISSNRDNKVNIYKRHISTYKQPFVSLIDRFVNRKLKKNSIIFAICYNNSLFNITTDNLKNQYQQMIYVDIDAKGVIEVASNWREDNKLEFDNISKEVYNTISPLLKQINEMGGAAFPVGGKLSSITEDNNVIYTFGNITISTYWNQVVSTNGFKQIKNKFREYEKAGIINIKGLQHGGTYSFMFKKGIVNYEKIENLSHTLVNQYNWLNDSNEKQKWENSHQGRLVKVYHRVSDLKIEIVDAYDINEFLIIQKYILSFLDNMLTGPDKLVLNNKEIKDTDVSNTLKRLQERDPNLFDLKKYDQNSLVYSVLCQSGRQPLIYDEGEIEDLNEQKKKKLIKYWNFTDNELAYYECPDKNYSHLSFRSGKHPLGYCLPCCKKTKSVLNSKSSKINKQCLEKKSIKHQKNDNDDSRHILSYGKEISPDRLSNLPNELTNGLFLNCIKHPFSLYIIGVEQVTPAVPDAGFIYALAYTISYEGKSQYEIIEEIANYASEMEEIYYILGNGYASMFSSSTDLAEEIRSVFIRKDDKLSIFGPGGKLEHHWKNIITDIVRYFYNIEIVTFSGSEGSISLEFRLESKSSLLENINKINTRISLLIINEIGTYPICALNQKQYLKIQKHDRWMIIRNNFGDDSEIFKENNEFIMDSIFITLINVLSYSVEKSNEFDLMNIMEYSDDKKSLYKIEKRFINLNNLCYGVLFSNNVYIPIKQ